MAGTSPVHHSWHGPQDRLLRLLGNRVEGRSQVVVGMLRRDANESMSYWLQLVVSVGIATLGLVVGSAAVVIGAMLVAPLMGPIIALAMGLSTGSPFLVLRSAGRIVLSVALAVGGAAAITLLLPFHELNDEIAARTTPTVLDLLTAAFCALAGVYAALRPGSDTATTAAGTSIGISLVPPLCASGYGLGTLAWPVAGGAALLFLTNLVAIVAVGTVAFVGCGFNRVDVATLERDELSSQNDAPIARALARRLARLFESKAGPALRFFMPFALLAAVYVPLRQALDEVAWEVKVRRAVAEALAQEPGRVVQSKAQVGRHRVELVVVLLGKTHDAALTRERLARRIRQVAGIQPSIEVLAIPDATAFAGLESTLLTPHRSAPPPPLSEGAQIAQGTTAARVAVSSVWPAAAAGELLAVSAGREDGEALRVRVAHLGQPLGPVGLEALTKSLSERLSEPVQLDDLALPSEPITRAEGDLSFIARIAAVAHASREVHQLVLCLARPDASEPRKLAASKVDLAEAVDRALDAHPRLVTTEGDDFTLLVAREACPPSDKTRDAREPPQ